MKPTTLLRSSFGHLWEWLIQRWVEYSGRKVEAASAPWLAGPTGAGTIGVGFYDSYARKAGLVVGHQSDAGLLERFNSLTSASFAPGKVRQEIRSFYEHTAHYTLDAWAQWSGPISPFAKALIFSISRNIEQLNLPLTPLTTSHGMSSQIITLADEQTGATIYAGWLRKAVATDDIVYAGFYTTCQPPGSGGRCVKVVFPLPQGSATVILRPANARGGSFKLVSAGSKFGGPGSYRIHAVKGGYLRVKRVPIEETIHVYVAKDGVLRTDHRFKFWGIPFLALHYKIVPKRPAVSA